MYSPPQGTSLVGITGRKTREGTFGDAGKFGEICLMAAVGCQGTILKNRIWFICFDVVMGSFHAQSVDEKDGK